LNFVAIPLSKIFFNPAVYVEVRPFADETHTTYTDNVFTFTKTGIGAEKTTVHKEFSV
jgi:hypothetical protein